MSWSQESESVLATLLAMVPETVRALADATAREESEAVASERGAAEVAPGDVVRGWIRTTPPGQRNALVALIEDLDLDPMAFADDLQSENGWGDEEGLDSER